MSNPESSAKQPRTALVHQAGEPAGHLVEMPGKGWSFTYLPEYDGPAVSLTMPVRAEPYEFGSFPPPFEGLLPEGPQLEALLRKHKIDRHDTFQQLVTVGGDLVGSLTISTSTTNTIRTGEP